MLPYTAEKPPKLPTYDVSSSYSVYPEDAATQQRSAWRKWAYALSFIAAIYILFPTHHCSHHTPPLPTDFLKQCNNLLSPPRGSYTDRISRLTSALANDTIWISEPGTSSEYFIGGFSSRDWWLSERPLLIALSPSTVNVTILTAKFEQARAELVDLPKEIRDMTTFVPWLESESPYDVLIWHFGAESKSVILDGQVRSFISDGLEGVGYGKSTQEEGEKIKEIRERKDEREIGLLRCANQRSLKEMLRVRMTLHAIKKTREKMHFGITEAKTRSILEEEMAKTGLVAGDGLVLFGENAATPHGEGSSRKLGREDMILIDAGGKWGGYTADVTRTFSLKGSKIPSRHIEVWETVRKAQYSAYLALTNSSTPHFAQLDAAARNLITRYIDPSYNGTEPDYSVFTTRLGHGIGLDGHESPFVNQGPQGEREVKAGHVFSIEPGIYIPSDMHVNSLSGVGVRLEDCFVVTEKDGKLDGEWLTGPVSSWGDI